MVYQVKTEGFEGPIELLLELSQKNEINIYEIWISRITSQYLEYLSAVQTLNLEEALEFLVIAASLVYLKSRALLPQQTPGEIAEEERLKETLEGQVQEYERYKKIADQLHEKAEFASQQFRRPVPEELKKEEYIEANLYDLVSAFKAVLADLEKKEKVVEIAREVITVEQKMEEILNMFTPENTIVKFSQVFISNTTRLEIVVSFLAILELIRLKKIRAIQKGLFEEIELVKIN